MSDQKQRKLAAIMFTDLVGFSSLMNEDEDRAIQMLDRHDQLVDAAISKFDGNLLKRMGDAVFAEFGSASAAVSCAVDIQQNLHEFNKDKNSRDQIWVRIGLHVGDVMVRNGDLFGDGINVAARLEPIAEPGGICISQAVYNLIKSHMNVAPILVGEVELKNILEKQTIYRIPTMLAIEQESAASSDQQSIELEAASDSTKDAPDSTKDAADSSPNPYIKKLGIPLALGFLVVGVVYSLLPNQRVDGYAGTWQCDRTIRQIEGNAIVGTSTIKLVPTEESTYSFSFHEVLYSDKVKVDSRHKGRGTLKDGELTLRAENGTQLINDKPTRRVIDGKNARFKDGQWVEEVVEPTVFSLKDKHMIRLTANESLNVLSDDLLCSRVL